MGTSGQNSGLFGPRIVLLLVSPDYGCTVCFSAGARPRTRQKRVSAPPSLSRHPLFAPTPSTHTACRDMDARIMVRPLRFKLFAVAAPWRVFCCRRCPRWNVCVALLTAILAVFAEKKRKTEDGEEDGEEVCSHPFINKASYEMREMGVAAEVDVNK